MIERGDILWRGYWASAAGIEASRKSRPSRVIPARKYETVTVPGRNGSLLFDQGTYDDVEVTYDVCTKAEVRDVQHVIDLLAWWLGSEGEHVLRDTYDPTHYRIGHVGDDVTVSDKLGLVGQAKITFVCRPQRWLVTGETAIAVPDGKRIANPTSFAAQPLIKVTGSGAGALQVGGYQIGIESIPPTGLWIDSEIKDCYGINNQNQNGNVTLPDGFPLLHEGETRFDYDGGVTGLEVTPRWWTL
jgi:predicted phage tail component-like protein